MNNRLIPVSFALLFGCSVTASLLAAEAPVITINGVDDALRANILSHLRIGGESCDVGMARLLRLREQVMLNTQRAANALGYYHSSIDLNFSQSENCWALLITIDPGQPVIISEVDIDIEGDDPALFREIIGEAGLTPGRQLNHGDYERLKNDLSAAAVENGYFAARFTRSSVNVDLVENSADINILFTPGPRYLIGEISINNASMLNDEFVRSMFPLQTGDPYANRELITLRSNLDQSQYFSQVSIRPQLSQTANQTVPLAIDLQPRPRHEYSAGIGFTTDTGPRIRLGYENRYQTRNGHRINGDISLAEVRQQGNVNYIMPLSRNPLRESLRYSAGYISEDNETFDSNRYELKTTYSNESRSGWLRNTFINYQRDDYVINLQTDTSYLTILGFNLSRTSANNLINPTRGWKFFAELSGASDSVLSDTTFIQSNINGKYITELGRNGRILTRFDSGFTLIDEELELPASLRFISGGDESIRGYKYRSLGPVDDTGAVIGGKHLVNGSLEYDYAFRPRWRFAIFYDTGNAFKGY